MEDSTKISIKVAAALSENSGIFWKLQLVDKNMTVQDLIETRLPDTSYYSSENIHALRMRTNTLLDKDKRLQSCELDPEEKIKIVTLTKEEVEKYKPKWRPVHPGCRFATSK